MKDKEMIEEMAKDLKEEKLYALINKTSYMRSAENLYDLGYRKLPKDSVVLSREEYEKQKAKCADCFNEWEKVVKENEKLKNYNDKLSQGIYWGNGEQFCNRLKEERKETAKNILTKLQPYIGGWVLFKELENEYGVKIDIKE